MWVSYTCKHTYGYHIHVCGSYTWKPYTRVYDHMSVRHRVIELNHMCVFRKHTYGVIYLYSYVCTTYTCTGNTHIRALIYVSSYTCTHICVIRYSYMSTRIWVISITHIWVHVYDDTYVRTHIWVYTVVIYVSK